MNDDLEPAKKVLRNFLREVEDAKKYRKNISPPQSATSFSIADQQPVFNEQDFGVLSDDYWSKEDAYIWLYGEAWSYSQFMHPPKPRKIPEYYNQPAQPIYQQWLQEEREVFHKKCEKIPAPEELIFDDYLDEVALLTTEGAKVFFEKFEAISPIRKMSLADYLDKLFLLASEENEHRDVWIESLRCFLEFLRKDTQQDEKGFLEQLFPSQESCKGMEHRKGFLPVRKDGRIEKIERRFILRRIEETVYPVDIFMMAEILMNLARTVLEGRPNVQRSAAEALGFTWLCHVSGYSRLITRERIVFSTELHNFKIIEKDKPNPRTQPTHFVGIDSLYGVVDAPVSKTIHEYLLALPRSSGSARVFSMDLDVVSRTLREKGVEPSKRAPYLGKITFLTFMSPPRHDMIHHRPGSNVNRYKSRR